MPILNNSRHKDALRSLSQAEGARIGVSVQKWRIKCHERALDGGAGKLVRERTAGVLRMAGGEAENAERRERESDLARSPPLSSRFCVSERLNCPVVHKNNTFFLHNRLRLGRDHKLIISLTHLPALRLDSF